MTISNTASSVTYTGDGLVSEFDFLFPIRDENDIKVQLFEIATGEYTDLVLGQYSTTGIGPDSTGGTITYLMSGDPISSAYKIIISRITPLTQLWSTSRYGDFDPTTLEEALDRMAMGIQQVSNKADEVLLLAADFDEATNLAVAAQHAAEEAVTTAQQWATNPEDDPVEPGLFSALHWAAKAAASAAAAALSNPANYFLKTEFKDDGTASAPVKYTAAGGLYAKVLDVVSAAAAAISVKSAAAAQASLDVYDAAVMKWRLVKHTDNTFGLYNSAAVAWSWLVSVANVVTFTNSPLAPTPTTGDRTTKLATTQFVGNELALAGWTLAGTWDFASAVAQIDFTGLGSYSELMVVGLVTPASAAALHLRASPDGGTTWRTTGYRAKYFLFGGGSGSGSAVTDAMAIGQAGAGAKMYFIARITCFKDVLRTMYAADGYDFMGANNLVAVGVYDTAEAHNALRVIASTGNVGASGNYLRIYGRN